LNRVLVKPAVKIGAADAAAFAGQPDKRQSACAPPEADGPGFDAKNRGGVFVFKQSRSDGGVSLYDLFGFGHAARVRLRLVCRDRYIFCHIPLLETSTQRAFLRHRRLCKCLSCNVVTFGRLGTLSRVSRYQITRWRRAACKGKRGGKISNDEKSAKK
jgi:hypothetical protein